MTQSGLGGRLAIIAFLAGLYFVAAKLGLSMAFVHPSSTAVWPPTGIALAAFLVLGYRVWPGIFLGAFLANLTTAGSVATTIGIATGNTLEGLVGAYLVNRFAHGSHTFDHPQDVFKFAALAAMVSTTVSATFGVTSLALGGYANWADYGRIWLTWWLGDAGGALIVTPVLLLWSQNARLRLTLAQVKEAGLLLVTLLLAGQAVFGGVFPITTNIYPLAFLCVPILVWTAFRLSPRETATATLLLSGIAIWGTLHGFGPFVRDPQNESLLLLQAFLGVSAMIAMTLAAAVLERKRVEDALRDAQGELEQRVQERTTALRSAVDLLKNEVNEHTQTENALRASEERFRAFMDNSPAAAFMKDEEGRYTYVNKLIEHRFKSKVSDWLGKTDYDLWPAETAKQLREHDRSVLAQNKTMELFETAPDARGDQSHWLSLKFPVMDSAGRRFLGGVSLDITDRKRAEEALRESQERFRSAFGSAAIGMALVSPDGRWLQVNRSLCEIVGYSEQELLGATFQAITHPDDLEADLEYVHQMLAGEIQTYQLEKRYVHKLGHFVWILLSVSLVRDAQENPLYFISQIQDITARKQADEALRASEERFRSVTQSANDAIISADSRGIILSWNKGAKAIFGYQEEEVRGMPLTLLMPERYREAHLQGVKRVQATGESRVIGTTVELDGLKKDGSEFPLELSLATWRTMGETFYSAIVRDITERKRAEVALQKTEAQLRQAQKVESIGQLAGGIAHDFNNLLTVINSYSDMLLAETDYHNPLHHGLAEIKEAGYRAATLTQQLLAYSRQQVLKPKVLDLNAVVQNIMKLLRRLIGENINLSICPAPNLGRVKADRGQIEQVIMNLTVNARDAMPQGGQLTIETTNIELADTVSRNQGSMLSGSYVMLTVNDTGCGMDAHTQARVFEPFFTTKESGRGTGLGLSTAYGIVKQSGGYIDFSSEVGKGSTFRIYLPQVEEQVEPSEPAPACPEILRGTETILLVEDDETIRAVGQTILQRHGYTILKAGDAKEALHLAGKHQGPIHLLFTDVVMPGLSGPELAECLRSIRPDTKVLYTSGYTDKVRTQHNLMGLSNAFIQKPFTPETLTRKVREMLDSVPEPLQSSHSS